MLYFIHELGMAKDADLIGFRYNIVCYLLVYIFEKFLDFAFRSRPSFSWVACLFSSIRSLLTDSVRLGGSSFVCVLYGTTIHLFTGE